ncbi:MAG: hypothetical protein ACRYFU_17715 [Janthinobacterium lividum]
MGSLVMPGPQAGSKGPPRSGSERNSPSFSEWFPGFLREELKPYPGRGLLTLRIVIAAALTTLVIMTFRLPGAAIGGYYTLLLPRDSPTTTVRAVRTLLTCFLLSFTYTIVGAILFVDYPLTHFLWVIGSFFLAFYSLSIVSNYAAGSAFAVLIVLAVPIWDTPLPTALLVASNLWTVGSVALAASMTILVEYVFSLFETREELEIGLDDRLSTLQTYLKALAAGNVPQELDRKLHQLAIVGVSRLRKVASSGGVNQAEAARRSTAVSLVGRLVDLVASMQFLGPMGVDSNARLNALAERLGDTRGELKTSRRPASMAEPGAPDDRFPVLLELERTAESLQLSLSRDPSVLSPLDQAAPATPPLFVADAFTNPAHLNFALRGCLAASLCYIIMNAVAWPGLSTSLLTCTITALTSIGSSRQKQVLRVAGAIVGGLIFGMGSQVLILPMLDSIGGFLVLMMVVTAIAAWFSTASPRISYFGSQIGLAFYVIQLRGPFPQTNLGLARDNLMGILLGLLMMWVAFDMLGSKPAVVVMRELFATNLRLMAKLANPWANGRAADLAEIRALRDRISGNFGAVNAQADAVLFEVGFGRNGSLAMRERLLSLQPRLRSMFLLEIALLQYRTRVEPGSLAGGILEAQKAFDEETGALLEGMALHFSGGGRVPGEEGVKRTYGALEKAIGEAYGGRPTARAQAILTLSSHLIELSSRLAGSLREGGPPRG